MKTSQHTRAMEISASGLMRTLVSDIRIVMIGGIIMRPMRGAGLQA